MVVAALALSAVEGLAAGPVTASHSLAAIASGQEFDRLAGDTYDGSADRPAVLFVVDMRDGARVYFLDTNLYHRHTDFLSDAYLAQERGILFHANELHAREPRFMCGSIARRGDSPAYRLKWWNEMDPVHPGFGGKSGDAALAAVRKAFFKDLDVQPASAAAIPAGPAPINPGTAVGRVRWVARDGAAADGSGPEILAIQGTTPKTVPLSAGLVLTGEVSPLAHAMILAHNLGIPVLSRFNDEAALKAWDGKWATLKIAGGTFELREATPAEIEAAGRLQAQKKRPVFLPSDLDWSALTPLAEQRGVDWVRFGSKAANLGELVYAGDPALAVPSGFSIPFYHYAAFIRANGLDAEIRKVLDDPRIRTDAAIRASALSGLRKAFQNGKVPEALGAELHRLTSGSDKGWFVRSSSNMEDMPGFSAAGLFSTVPNVRGDGALQEAVKTVWASVWNDAAFEARERLGAVHTTNMMAVLVQEGIDADSAGVITTVDPLHPDEDSVMIAAKKGLGIRVVDGHAVPEQHVCRPSAGTTALLNRSEDTTRLVFASSGGVKPVEGERGAPVLSDDAALRLCRLAVKIRDVFGGPQDIEWVSRSGQFMIVQSRPYLAPADPVSRR